MKKILLASIAVLSLLNASAAHATDTLPDKDPLIGAWCIDKVNKNNSYKRGSCSSLDGYLKIAQDGYDFHEGGCTFFDIKRLPSNDGYMVRAECEGTAEYWNERAAFQIVGKKLRYRSIAATEPVNQDQIYCALVAGDMPDGFLNLRAGPDTYFNVKAKLVEGDEIEIDATSNGWKHVTNVPRLSTRKKTYSGWVFGKYVYWPHSCKEKPASALSPFTPEEFPTIDNPSPEKCHPKWLGLNRC